MQSNHSHLFTPFLQHHFHCIQFDPDSYSEQSFEQHNIFLPDTLEKAVAKRKAEFLAGRICAKASLTALGHDNFTVLNGSDRAPIWPNNVVASITHTRGIAAAIATNNTHTIGLGIDIERDMKPKQEIELQRQILHPAEFESFRGLAKHVHCPLTVIFSAKESIYKALYGTVNRFFGFDAVKLSQFDTHTLYFTLMENLHPQLSMGQTIKVFYQCTTGLVLTECEYHITSA
ncbi:4'-phosphopantetheinyl transferase superfamily protein [Pseudoalteromonas sp. McH1-7]|uniref:Enterobactin synthase component D n=1 Tax=Pseudoalteromonas peptidolytica F12-50-A1 TaxID=1315280 RepID=A0A8I0MZ61_9GAMM|nr:MULTISPECIES: 4'-phosphopantetheinyl transferase superfamily protein [Pseudoalteromonas]MBE0348173.1 enterobactin synthetase component D [Pseudoalteromonas peptidolytica F12-50-A1]MDW7550923.1 4'-phosphopantetheinyl transferase superfamily protein [Pseudoalteromonas peptidolytica]NLR15487.1 4'-phosphopantetheinyl transferase superfamily protein [Pseudoalteromonas peptidolytica]NUZ12138.1 4'-phosphopantetheinyl transferase superfamily protein [Pseudoalteromonas sp. McH1-7]RRS09544.1 4'-phosp